MFKFLKWQFFTNYIHHFLSFNLLFIFLLTFTFGCNSNSPKNSPNQESSTSKTQKIPSVEIAKAEFKFLTEPVEYVGNTEPLSKVSVRSQIEARLLNLKVDVGDSVLSGQILAELDNTLLQTAIDEAQAELAVLDSEVISAKNEVTNAQILVEQAQVELTQTQADAKRLQYLLGEGAISLQQAETAVSNAKIAQQKLRSSQKQVKIKQEEVITAQKRIKVQLSKIQEAQERLSYSILKSPLKGIVLEKMTETGNLLQPGNEVLKIGDFSQVKIVVPLSELKLKDIFLQQKVKVKIDAFADDTFTGQITRISPTSNSQTRQIPVEITISNTEGKIGSGLLARVLFPDNEEKIVIPITALQGENKNIIFVIQENGEDITVQARKVTLGKQLNNLVEINSGLKPQERFVVRSSTTLNDGKKVRLSILSQTN